MMEKREYHTAIQMLRSAITLLGPFSPAIWIPRLGFAFIPGLWKVKDWFGMLTFCDSCMERRMKVRFFPLGILRRHLLTFERFLS